MLVPVNSAATSEESPISCNGDLSLLAIGDASLQAKVGTAQLFLWI